MKILLLVEDIAKISQLLRQDSSLKVIDEYELTEATPYTGGINQVGYSDYIVNRAANLSIIYKFNKTLCIVLDQRHKNSVDKIPHDVSIRVCKSLVPKRLIDSFIQKVDKTYLEDNFNLDGLVA
jgi:hypothetical protein